MYIEQFFVEGLGCASYLLGCEAQGVAAVVDPDRDVERYLKSAENRGLKITHIIETHLHADHVSGNTDLAAQSGADIYLHEAAGAEFTHKDLRDGDVLVLGAVKIRVAATPGHTPESITLFVSDTKRAAEPWMALTGDLLFVGDVGRPDLVGAEAARGLAGELYESLFNKVLKNEDALLIYPGHGAGSLCGRSTAAPAGAGGGAGSVRSTTLGFERKHNPALAVRAKDEFVEYMTTNLPEQPGNHRRIKAMNRKGPKPLGGISPRKLSVDEAIPYFQQGAGLLDTRSKEEYVKIHVPGSVHLEANKDLSNRVGFVLPPGVPLVLVVESESDFHQIVLSLARVGYDNVIGYLADGLPGWQAAGLPVASGDIQDLPASDLFALLGSSNGDKPVVIDVREPWEVRMGAVPGSINVPLGQLAGRLSEFDRDRPVAVICEHGNRSQAAAALLGQKGFVKVYNILGGTNSWREAGLPVSRNG